MTNSETRFGIHILFFSVPSLRKRWFRSRSTRSSRRRRGIHSSRRGKALVKLVVLLPDHVLDARAEQPIPRPRTAVRSLRHGRMRSSRHGRAQRALGQTAPAPTTLRASRPGRPGDGDNRLAPSTQEKPRPHKGKMRRATKAKRAQTIALMSGTPGKTFSTKSRQT